MTVIRRCGLSLAALAAWGLAHPGAMAAQEPLRVITTLPTYAALAREVGGDLVTVEAIARGDMDPHFVQPRPSFAAKLRRADVFVSTGLDLELWVPALLDRANNAAVREGGPGHVVAYTGVTLLDIPANVSRSGGDVHAFGNPHIHTDPINAILIARNIAAGFQRVDPDHGERYQDRLASFERRVVRRLVGDELVELLGDTLVTDLGRGGQLWHFLTTQSLGGRPLLDRLGGWLAEAAPFRDRVAVCYHKNWAYFTARFRLRCGMFIEPLPGIPPTPGHVRDVIEFIRTEGVPVLLAANYYNRNQIDRVAERTGARAVVVPEHVDGAEGVDDYFRLVDTWVTQLAAAFTPTPG